MKNCCLLFMLFPFFATAQELHRYYVKPKEIGGYRSRILIDSTVTILNKRLSNQGYKNSSVSYDDSKKRFIITAGDFIDTNYIKLWLIKPFKISFCEVYTKQEIVSVFSLNEMNQTARKKVREFYQLLGIDPAGEQFYRYPYYLGTLQLSDTTKFNEIKKVLKPNLPDDIVFAYPRKLSSSNASFLEVYGLRDNAFKIEANDLFRKTYVGKDERGYPTIEFEFNKKGQDAFAALTGKNKGKPIAILIDGRVCTAPFVNAEITGGKVEITGSFTQYEADQIVDILLAGCLPLNLVFTGE